jgi:hypothetical protein
MGKSAVSQLVLMGRLQSLRRREKWQMKYEYNVLIV